MPEIRKAYGHQPTGASSAVITRLGGGGEFEIVPAVVPDSAEDVFIDDIWLLSIHLVNRSYEDVTVTITDKQAVPLEVVPAVTIEAYSDHIREFSGRFCPGGLTWVASASDAVVGYIRGRQ